MAPMPWCSRSFLRAGHRAVLHAAMVEQADCARAACRGIGVHSLFVQVGAPRAYTSASASNTILAIQSDPRNWGARERLAETLYNMGGSTGRSMRCRRPSTLEREWKRITSSPTGARSATSETLGIPCAGGAISRMRAASGSAHNAAPTCRTNSFARWLSGGRKGRFKDISARPGRRRTDGSSLLALPLRYAFIPVGCAFLGLAGWALLASARS